MRLHWNVPLRAVLTALALALCAAAADTPAPDEVRKTAGELTRTLGVQTKLPNDSGTPEASSKRRSDGRPIFGGGEGFSIPAPAAVIDLMTWALVVIAIIAFIALVATMIREPLQARFHPTLSPAMPLPDEPRHADPGDLVAEADRLAAAGQYAEAMHCVLFAAAAILGRGRPQKTSDSLTSWELVRGATLAPPQHRALRDLVVRVERAWFGQRPAGPDDYQQVRGSFQVFTSSQEANPA